MKTCMTKKMVGRRGQITVEYAVMFTVVVAVVIWAGWSAVRPSANRFFLSASNVINKTATEIENHF